MAVGYDAASDRSYRRQQLPEEVAGYIRELFLRLLKAIHRKQSLAQLIALELSADYLVCPIFTERLLSAALAGGKKDAPNPARVLDLALAMLLGMILVEGETPVADRAASPAHAFSTRVKTYPPDDFPALLASRTELTLQLQRRLVDIPILVTKAAHWYAEPLIAALKLKDTASGS